MGGIIKISKVSVIMPFKTKVKFLNLMYESLSFARAVDALMIMMTGASMNTAKEKATPNAARLNLGFASLAMIAARKGPSVAIISHVAASGIQKKNIFL
jgi:hypothetical protein